MAVNPAGLLKIGSMLPVFHLPALDGRVISPWDYKEHCNLVLIFLPANGCADCTSFIRDLAGDPGLLDEETTEVLLVVKGDKDSAARIQSEFGAPFPVLYDEAGSIAALYTDRLPAVFVADRFGQLYAEWAETMPAKKDVFDVVELRNLDCPECGAPLEWSEPGCDVPRG